MASGQEPGQEEAVISRIPRHRHSAARIQEERVGWLFVAPVMLYVVVVFILPAIFMVYLALFRWSPIEGSGPFVGLQIVRETVRDALMWKSFLNTAVFLLASVPATVLLSLLAATAFCRRSPLPWKSFFKVAYFLPLITSLAATAFIWLWMFNPSYGLFNTLLGILGLPRMNWLADTAQVIPSLAIMYVWVRLGFDMAIFLAGLEGIPEEFYEAATLDGAGKYQAFLKITLPLLNPQLVLVSVIEVITALRTFDLPYLATHGGPLNASRTVVLHIYDTAFHYNEPSKASVVALLLFAVILLITFIQLRVASRQVDY
jgi:multiple sugar transport system permease protein